MLGFPHPLTQERVLSLERELSSNRELSETPGPRESALSGQLDRLKQDYATLESELQVSSYVPNIFLGSGLVM